ncbi:MAG: family 10 glycosylhydrolase [Lewinella sp.]|nr:family 10 glycosylhydrolase [Lewinella sp.]
MQFLFHGSPSRLDALYPSALAPWSKWLTGRQGSAPGSNFDPLAFMIESAHSLGIEFHAWLNPYRVSMDLDTFALAPSQVFNQHRDWVVRYGDRLYLDPGLPQVQNHVLEVVAELVKKYPLDGVHFDDYFYPYPIAGLTFPDAASFQRFAAVGQSREDWRRANVNTMVAKVSRRIKELKPWVKFGISPFGVWRNDSRDPRGSATRASASSYDDLYADALAWPSRQR